ncbi:MAG: mandelate racemase/muconate lactonizing enzyme family protein [Abditibacteriales bacterium]|nr:mandelate racemase/muconate lactonizing enzyme family protein [Abditibacteriales bacterium]MDW8365574.1 mandelate racemase/muconate lactonizing enzyme family protein [Abditibacteriales bacterium]
MVALIRRRQACGNGCGGEAQRANDQLITMRITDVRALWLSAPLEQPIGGSSRKKTWFNRQAVLVEVHTDEDLVGIGEVFTTVPEVALVAVSKFYQPLLLGENPLDIERLWEKMYFGAGYSGVKGVMIEALSGIDIALWDLRGKVENRPVWQLLPSSSRPLSPAPLPAYAAGGFWAPLADTLAEITGYVAHGFASVKMKVGLGIEEDGQRIAAVRQTIGNDVKLMIDANCGYTADQAIALGKRVEEHNVYWFEEPVLVEDWDGYKKVRESLSMKIAGGEGEYTRWGFRELIGRGCVDIAQPDVMRCGGLTESVKIAQIAAQHNVAYAPHVFCSIVGLAASLHLAAVAPSFEIFEFDMTPNPLRTHLAKTPIEVKDSRVSVPNGAGLGIELDDDALARYMVVRA